MEQTTAEADTKSKSQSLNFENTLIEGSWKDGGHFLSDSRERDMRLEIPTAVRTSRYAYFNQKVLQFNAQIEKIDAKLVELNKYHRKFPTADVKKAITEKNIERKKLDTERYKALVNRGR